MRKLHTFSVAFFLAAALVCANDTYRIEAIDGYTPEPDSGAVRISRKHTGPVTAIAAVHGTDIFYSAGQDGFVSRFGPAGFEQTWQVSELPVVRIAADTTGTRIATYESDGFSIHRVAVWDWENKTRLYAKRFRDSVTALTWSAQGTYLIVGHSSLEGITIFDGSSGSVKQIFSQSPGIITLAATGASEASIITFGPSGNIKYTDLRNGTERASYRGEPDLSSPVMMNNNLVIAGVYNNTLYTVDATSGKLLYSYKTNSPVMATHSTDREPRWFENTPNGPAIVQGTNSAVPVTGVESPVRTAASLETKIAFGTENGSLYSIPRTESREAQFIAEPFAANDIHRIDSVATDGSTLYILSEGSVFTATDPETAPRFLFSGMTTSNRITVTDEGLLFWSSIEPAAVIHTGFDGENRQLVYDARDGITSLSLYGTLVACIEGNSTSVVFDLDKQLPPFVYTGAGLQDAVLIHSEKLVVSKSSTRISPHVLLSINTRTGETVPVPMEGNLVYGLTRALGEPGILYAFRVMESGTVMTELISLDIKPAAIAETKIKVLARYGDEDTDARLNADSGKILTTLGKAAMVELTIRNGRQDPLARSYSLPSQPLFLSRYSISLNHDGSVSWYHRSRRNLVTTAYISTEGFWILE